MQSLHHFCHLLNVEGVDRIRLQVIVPVSEEGGICDHDSPVSMAPEIPCLHLMMKPQLSARAFQHHVPFGA